MSNGDPPRYILIAEDLRLRIKDEGLGPGEPLTPIPDLAGHYDAARGTIGKALLVLKAEGLTERYPGVGWVVAGAGDARPWVQLAADIRDQIADGRLKPGARVSICSLHRRHGLARQTVTKAMKILEAEGLVTATAAGTAPCVLRGNPSPADDLNAVNGAGNGGIARLQ
jgi:DNA-binding GntR family transcriptional regulator